MHKTYLLSQILLQNVQYNGLHRVNSPMQPSSNCHQKWLYLRLLSYMLLDWAQILKGSGFLWMVPSAGESWGGRLGRGWEGGGGAALSLRGGARDGCTGESVWMLRWLETLCWELFWLSFLDNCCWRSRSISFDNLKSAASVHLCKWRMRTGRQEETKRSMLCSGKMRRIGAVVCERRNEVRIQKNSGLELTEMLLLGVKWSRI